MRMPTVLFVFFFSFSLGAAEQLVWDVVVRDQEPAAQQALGDLDVWSVYRDAEGRWHYRVGASDADMLVLRHIFLQADPLMSLSEVVPPPASEYRDADKVRADLADLEGNYPQRARLYEIGETIEKCSIVALKISADPSRNLPNKTEVLFVAMHHAREWIGVEVLLRMAEFLLEQYDYSPRIKEIVDSTEIWLVPMLNEDGYRYSWEKDRYWRKNRRHNADNSYGVDLNRNYDADWGGEGSSKKGSSDVYCGTAPFSEPETAAIRDLLDPKNGIMDAPAGFIDFHSYSQLILYPYGNTEERSPREKEMAAIAQTMSDLIMAETGVAYEATKSSELYVATGAGSDWFHLAYEFRNSLTVELRPGGDELNGFSLPTEQIKGTARENVVATLYFIEATMTESPEVDTDRNGNGVVDYLEGCGETLCAMLYDDRADEESSPDDEVLDADTDYTNDELFDSAEATDEDTVIAADGDDSSDETDLESDVDTDTPRRKASDGGCSLLFF